MLSSVKTVARLRPFVHEIEKHSDIKAVVEIQQKEQAVLLTDPISSNDKPKRFACDYCLNSFQPPGEVGHASQDTVWQTVGLEVVADALDGFNTSVISYGQTGTGKSYTMFNEDGIAIKIAKEIQRRGMTSDAEKFHMECSMLEIYNEALVDLLLTEAGKAGEPIEVFQTPDGQPYLRGAVAVAIKDINNISRIIKLGLKARAVRETQYNMESSRSHVLCILNVYRRSGTVASIILADLAGHERHTNMGTSGDRLLETNLINKSLDHLNKVINLAKNPNAQKDDLNVLCSGSLLTSILKESIAGNARSWWVATISPSNIDYHETLSTLRFMEELRTLRCKVKANKNFVENFEKGSIKRISELEQEIQELSSSNTPEIGKQEIKLKVKYMQESIEEFRRKIAELKRPWSELTLSAFPQILARVGNLEKEEAKITTIDCYYLVNISRDPFLSGRIIHFVDKAEIALGNSDDTDITISGINIEAWHCTFQSKNVPVEAVSLICTNDALTRINGKILKAGDNYVLKVGDIITFGTLVNFQLLRKDIAIERASLSNWYKVHKDINGQKLRSLSSNLRMLLQKASNEKSRQSLHELERELLMAIVDVEEANEISKVLHKHETFEPTVVLDNFSQHKLILRIKVLTKNSGVEVSSSKGKTKIREAKWSKDKFCMRLFLMRKMYQDFLSSKCNGNIRTLDKLYPTERDPFHDPPPDTLIGKAMIYLNPLRFICAIDTPISIIDMRGSNEGELLVNINPTVYRKKSLGSEDIVDTDDENLEEDPRLEHFLNGRVDVNVKIKDVRGLRSSRQNNVYAMFRWYNRNDTFITAVISDGAEAKLQYEIILSETITKNLIDYFKKDVVEVSVFCSPIDGTDALDDSSLREGFLSTEPRSGYENLYLSSHNDANSDLGFSEANDDVLNGMVMTEEIASQNLRPGDERNIKAAYYEREQLELKIRELEEALRRKKSNSGICIVL